MIINFPDVSALTRYHLLTQTVIPRPIAWVLSENTDHSLNLAPFSFFSAVCSDPPLLMMSIGKKPSGELKDTRRNLTSGRDFVVHIAGIDSADALNNSAAVLDYGTSEVLDNNLPLCDFPGCAISRLKNCLVAYHCRLYDIHELGPNQQAVIYAEIQNLYIDDTIASEGQGRFSIDANGLNPLARLGGSEYTGIGEAFSLARPK